MRFDIRLLSCLIYAAATDSGHVRPVVRNASAIDPARTGLQAKSPGTRDGAVFVYDAASKEMVLYGGAVRDASGQLTPRSDLWDWNGTSWRELIPSDGVVPPDRGAPHVAYDAARQRIIMFGGLRTALLGDLWEWDGRRWQEIRSDTFPILHAAVAYDPSRHGVVASFGIDNAGITRKTVAWDGRTWNAVDRNGPPLPREAGIAAVIASMPGGELVVVTQQRGVRPTPWPC